MTVPPGGRRPPGRPAHSDVPRRLRVAAKQLLSARGYDELRVRDIADAAGVSTATMYKYVEGLDELLVGIYWEQFRDWLVQEVRTVADRPGPPLAAAAAHAATLAAEQPNLTAGIVRALLSPEPAVRERRLVIDRVLHEGILRMLGETAESSAADVVAAAWRGAFIDWALGSSSHAQLRRVLADVAALVQPPLSDDPGAPRR